MNADKPQLNLDCCRARQERLRTILQAKKLDRAVLSSGEHVQYFTGFRPHPLTQAAVVVDVDGNCVLIAPGSEPERHAATKVLPYEAQWRATLRQDQIAAIRSVLKTERMIGSGSTGTEGSRGGLHGLDAAGTTGDTTWLDLEPDLWRLRRRKDPDEIELIRHAIRCTDAMYGRAREILQPGICELEVFNQLQAAAVETAGEMLTGTGNDYQANSPGGPPRNRRALGGELFVLDLGPSFRGYYADNCRTFAVNGKPSDEQVEARTVIQSVLDLVASTVRPGKSCAEFFLQAKAVLDDFMPDSFFHHLGHGIGLFPHETPHLNPAWDDVFEEGDVFTVEPGLYDETLRGGIRIEEDYLVTENGVRQLTSYPTGL